MSFLGAPATAAEQPFCEEQIDQLTVQVALYPDALLSQVLMASTYPSDVAGFALVAWPARYGDTGVMTFIVSRDVVVYEKDLGPQTASIARGMKAYDPDATLKKADIND